MCAPARRPSRASSLCAIGPRGRSPSSSRSGPGSGTRSTADRLSATQAFRDLFSDQVLRPGDEVGIGNVALMFTDLKGSTALYEAIGSAPAYRLVRDHFALLAAVVREHDGSVVKTIGDAVMASFADPRDAVAAALAVQGRVAEFNRRSVGQAITIKLGVHCGPCIAVTLNDRLDYFGSTVNLAARLQSESVGGDIVLSADVLADPRVRDLLRGQHPDRAERGAPGLCGTGRVLSSDLRPCSPRARSSEDPGDRAGQAGDELRGGVLELEVDLLALLITRVW